MSSRFPATVTLSLEEFSRHGGQTGPHRDGWGIAYYEGPDARIIREPAPAADSRCADLIGELGLQSSTVVSHIRKATQGEVRLANTQPFSRELGGHRHVFAHNGELEGLEAVASLSLGRFRPVGDTDSEQAFCALMARLEERWLLSDGVPPLADRTQIVDAFAAAIRPLGPANFIYADGDAVFVHGDRRTQFPGGPKVPPGLHTLCRTCTRHGAPAPRDIAGLSIDPGDQEQRVVLVASVPLTDERWQPAPTGEILVFRAGAQVTPATLSAAPVAV